MRLLSRGERRDMLTVDFKNLASLAAAFDGVDTVFHCAGRSHAFAEVGDVELHRQANETVSHNTARAAAAAGVRRFVFLSSVKAACEPHERCVDESFVEPPETTYGRSKRAAEIGLEEIAAQTHMHAVILRLAMVYGPGSRGNLERMMRLVQKGQFPSLPETGNRRSLVHVDDVIEAMLLAAHHPSAAGTYIVAHPDATSGRVLFVTMCEAAGRPVPSFEIPAWLLRMAGRVGDTAGALVGRRMPLDSQAVSRLLDSACYSSKKLIRELGWQPRIDLRNGLRTLVAEPRIE